MKMLSLRHTDSIRRTHEILSNPERLHRDDREGSPRRRQRAAHVRRMGISGHAAKRQRTARRPHPHVGTMPPGIEGGIAFNWGGTNFLGHTSRRSRTERRAADRDYPSYRRAHSTLPRLHEWERYARDHFASKYCRLRRWETMDLPNHEMLTAQGWCEQPNHGVDHDNTDQTRFPSDHIIADETDR